MNYPSAVNVARMPQSHVPDNSQMVRSIQQGIGSIADTTVGIMKKKKINSLVDDLNKEPEAPLSEAEKNTAITNSWASAIQKKEVAQQLGIDAAQEAEIEKINATANESRRITSENANQQRILGDPENKAKFLELYRLDPQLAKLTLDIAKSNDDQAKLAHAAAAQDALRTFHNYKALATTQGKEAADNFIMGKAREVFAASGQDPKSVERFLALKNTDQDQALALVDQYTARAGGVLAIPEVQEAFTLSEGAKRFDGNGNVIAENPKVKGGAGGLASAKTEIFEDGTVIQALPDGTVQVQNPSGQVVTGQERLDALENSRRLKTEMKRQAAQVLVEKTENLNKVERKKVAISDAVDAAKSIPVVKRAIDLLQEVETGGWESVKFKLQRFTGLESGNQAELAHALDARVLQQIKPLFGAAPSAVEGQWLRDIEAGMAKGTAGNKRLMIQALRLLDVKADLGIKAAKGDKFALDEINTYRNFSFSQNPVYNPETDEFE